MNSLPDNCILVAQSERNWRQRSVRNIHLRTKILVSYWATGRLCDLLTFQIFVAFPPLARRFSAKLLLA